MTDYTPINSSDESPADGALRRVLAAHARNGAPAPPEVIVQQTLRRLPAAPPHVLRKAERSQQVASRILRSSSLAAVVVLLALSSWGALGGVPQLDARNSAAIQTFQAAVVPQAGVPLSEGLVIRATLAALVGLALLVPSALLLGRWPKRTGVAAHVLGRYPARAVIVGLPVVLLLSALLPLAVQLGLTIVGLPLAALLLVVAVAPQVAGLAALARAIGARFEDAPGAMLGWPTAATAALVVLVLVAATMVAPLTALVVFSLLAAPGLGAVLLSRVGTRL